MPKLKAKYGDFDDVFYLNVKNADDELALCEGCNGDCQKPNQRWLKPVVHVEDETVYVGVTYCQFGRNRRLKSGCKLARIPPKYVGKTFDEYRVTNANREAVKIARWLTSQRSHKGAYFFGGVGTGKTLLAAIVAQEFIADGDRVIFGDVPSLLADIKATFDKGSTATFLDELLTVDLLVLDDIGAEKITDWSAEQVYLLINGRYNAGLPVIVTSNYDFDGLVKRYGGDIIAKRFTSRLREMTAQAFFGTQDWRN